MLFAVFARSCRSCNVATFRVFDHEPTPEEVEATGRELGTMICIRARALRMEGCAATFSLHPED